MEGHARNEVMGSPMTVAPFLLGIVRHDLCRNCANRWHKKRRNARIHASLLKGTTDRAGA
jgi:hypothetical protein